MEQRLGRKVVLGNLQLKLIPPRLRVENLAISEDPAFGRHTPFLSRGELVIPGLITGTFENPKFEFDMEQLGVMRRLKGILPTSDNPFGVLGTLFGHDKQKNKTKPPSQGPSKGLDKFFGKLPGGKEN